MKKVLFLSSALVMGMVSFGVYAADEIITGGAGTCTVDVLGVSDNNATANTIATWSLNSYDCTAGQYLDETTLNCTECPVGSYCPGGTYTVESENMGKTACPTDYTSDVAATAESECYMGCELACSVNAECPPHSKNCTHSAFTTTGKQYVDATCNAYPSVCPVADVECNVGYTKYAFDVSSLDEVSSSVVLFYLQNQNYFMSCAINNEDKTDGNNINDCDIIGPGQILLMNRDYALIFQYSMNSYNPNELSSVKTATYPEYPDCDTCDSTVTMKYIENANFAPEHSGENSWYTLKYVGLPNMATTPILYSAINEYYDSGTLSLDTVSTLQTILSGTALKIFNNTLQNAESLSQQQINHAFYTVLFLSMDKLNVNLPWIANPYGSDSTDILGNYIFVRWNMLVPNWTSELCINNTINIDWNPDNGGEHTQNMCMYNGAIEVPEDPVKPGYTFMGWKLVESTTTTE